MTREMYNIKRKTITAAKDLLYPQEVVENLQKAETVEELSSIMSKARQAS